MARRNKGGVFQNRSRSGERAEGRDGENDQRQKGKDGGGHNRGGLSDIRDGFDVLRLSKSEDNIRINVIEKYDRHGKPLMWTRTFRNIFPNTTIRDIKKQIEKNGKHGIRAIRMRLWIGNKEMLNTQTLGEFGKISVTLEAIAD